MNFKIIFPTGHQVTDLQNDNLDINVVLPTGEVYWGCLFTLANIKLLMEREAGHFFWAADMVIVQDLQKETIYKAIRELLEAGHLQSALSCIGDISTLYPECEDYDSLASCMMRLVK